MKITFLPTNTSKIYLQEEHSYRKSSEHLKKTPDFQKDKLIPKEWGTAKDVLKKEKKKREREKERKWDRDLHLREAAVKKEMFLHTQKPPHGWGDSFGTSEGSTATGVKKAKQLSTEGSANQNFTDWKANLHSCCGERWLGAEAQALGVRPQGEDWGWLPWRYSEGASMEQMRGARKKPGPPNQKRDHCH